MIDERLYFEGAFKKIADGRPYFARVRLRLDDEIECGGIGVELDDPSSISHSWVAAAVMGVAYALRQIECDHVHLTITSIVGTHCDTTPASVMVAAAEAAWMWSYPDGTERPDMLADDHIYLVERATEFPHRPNDSIPILHQ